MRLLLAILLLAAPAYGQIANPTTASSLGLGTTDSVSFSNVTVGSFPTGSDRGFAGQSSSKQLIMYGTNVTTSVPAFYGWTGFANTAMEAGTARTNLALGAANNVTFSNVTANGNATLSGVNNTATAQTASSASSLMTRGLSDARYSFSQWYTGYELLALDNTTTTLKTLNSGNASGGIFDNQMVTIPNENAKFNLPIDWRTTGQVKVVSYWSDRGATNVGGTNANIAIFCLPLIRTPTNNTTDSGGVSGTQVMTTFTATYGGTGRYYIVEQTLDFATVSGINATNPMQIKFVELQRRGADATDTSTNTIWLSGVHIYVP